MKELIIADGDSTLELKISYNGGPMFRKCPLERVYLGRNLNIYGYSEADTREKVEKYGCPTPFYGNTTLKTVTLGSHVTSLWDYAFTGCSGLTTINSLNPTPPEGTIYEDDFSYTQYKYITVNVPTGSLAAYQTVPVWRNFFNVQETGASGISTAKDDTDKTDRIFDISGRKLDKPRRGLNIINGRKVVVK